MTLIMGFSSLSEETTNQQKKYGAYLMIFDDNSMIILSNLHKTYVVGAH